MLADKAAQEYPPDARFAVQEYSPDAYFVVYVFRNLSTRQVGFGIGGSWQRTLGAWRLAVQEYSPDALFLL